MHSHPVLKFRLPDSTQVQNKYVNRAKLYNWDSAYQKSQGKQQKRS